MYNVYYGYLLFRYYYNQNLEYNDCDNNVDIYRTFKDIISICETFGKKLKFEFKTMYLIMQNSDGLPCYKSLTTTNDDEIRIDKYSPFDDVIEYVNEYPKNEELLIEAFRLQKDKHEMFKKVIDKRLHGKLATNIIDEYLTDDTLKQILFYLHKNNESTLLHYTLVIMYGHPSH